MFPITRIVAFGIQFPQLHTQKIPNPEIASLFRPHAHARRGSPLKTKMKRALMDKPTMPFVILVLPKSENPCAPVHSKNGLGCNYHPHSRFCLKVRILTNLSIPKNGLGVNDHPHSRFCLKVRIPCAPIHSEKMASSATTIPILDFA